MRSSETVGTHRRGSRAYSRSGGSANSRNSRLRLREKSSPGLPQLECRRTKAATSSELLSLRAKRGTRCALRAKTSTPGAHSTGFLAIEVFYFSGGPNHEPTLDVARQVARELGLDVEVSEVDVWNPPRRRSSSGRDLDTRPRHRNQYLELFIYPIIVRSQITPWVVRERWEGLEEGPGDC